MGELQIEAYKKEYRFKGLHTISQQIVDHLQISIQKFYGCCLDNKKRSLRKSLKVWGDGKAIRDFIFSGDVADSIIKVINNNIQEPINIGSGKGTSIKKLVKNSCLQ